MALWTDALTIPPASVLNGVGSSSAQRQAGAAAQRDAIPLVYGEDRIGGLVLNVLPAAADARTVVVQVLWCYACDAVLDPRLNDQALPVGALATHYIGTQSTVDPVLSAAFAARGSSYSATLAGYAFSVFQMPARAFSGALNFSARIRGRRVYDRRLDSTAGGSGAQRLNDPATWAHSSVPALCLADFLASPLYGAGEAVDWASAVVAANANDQAVGSPASEPRRRLGWSLTRASGVGEVVEALRAHAGCFVLPGSTGLRLVPDRDEVPAASYTHAAGDIAALEPLRVGDLGSAPTAVEVIYTDTSTIPWRDATALAAVPGAGTTLPWRLSQVRMPGVQRYSQAMREARERLNKLRQQAMSTTVELFDGGLRHDDGDLIALTHPVGLSATPFRVTNVTMPGPGRWRLAVVRHDPAANDDSVLTAPLPAPVWADVTPPASAAGGVLNANPACDDLGFWELQNAPQVVMGATTAVGAVGTQLFSCSGPDLNQYIWSREATPVDAVKRYSLTANILAASGNTRRVYLTVRLFRANGTELTGAETGWGGNYAGYAFGGVPVSDGVWRRYGDDFGNGTPRPIPAAAAFCRVGFWFQDGQLGGSTFLQAVQDLRLEDVTAARSASTAAAAAQAAADASGANATSALVRIAAYDSDGILARGEKPQVIIDRQALADEQAGIVAQANAYGITTERDAYTAALTALNSYLSGLSPDWANTSVDTSIIPAVYRAAWADVYTKRQALLNRIADEAGKRAQWGQVSGAGKPADNATVGAPAGTPVGAYSDAAAVKPAVDSAAGTAVWSGVSGSGKPADNATVGAPAGTPVGAYSDAAAVKPAVDSAAGTAVWSGVSGSGKPADNATRNDVYAQIADPGAVPNGAIWIQLNTGRTWQRFGGTWQPYVGDASIGTAQLAANAVSESMFDTFDFAGSTYGTTVARQVVWTPAAACQVDFDAGVYATNLVGDSGNTVGWYVQPAGGARVLLGGSGHNTTARAQAVVANTFTAAAGVQLTFELQVTRATGNPSIGLFTSFMRAVARKA